MTDTERNKRVQQRYDGLMDEGKQGHYETLFRIVREEIERLSVSPLPIFELDDEQYAAFVAALDLPTAPNEKLQQLMATHRSVARDEGFQEAWNLAHSPAQCGHARANWKDPKYGTPEYRGEEKCEVCAALEASVSPLPEEIEELSDFLRSPRFNDIKFEKAAATLQALARENERLKRIEDDYLRRHKDACDRWLRIRELEAERDCWKYEHATILDDIDKYISESAIRAKTVEECAQICDDAAEESPEPTFITAAERIRALNQEKPSEETGEERLIAEVAELAQAERAAIRAKTVEECIDYLSTQINASSRRMDRGAVFAEVAEMLRALKPSEETEEE